MLNESACLRVAVLCSKRAPGLDALLRSPERGRLFDVVCVVSSENDFADARHVESLGVPVLVHPIRRFFEARQRPLRNIETRREYDQLTARLLEQLSVDAVVCLGYLYVLTEPMLQAFPDRILNVHDSDLTIQNSDGKRRYVGLHSTRDAIAAGEIETRSSVHVVTNVLDGGPIVCVSRAYMVAHLAIEPGMRNRVDVIKAYAYAHREWMMQDSWGDLVVRALATISCGAEDEEVTEATRAVIA